MRCLHPSHPSRRGAIAPLAAVLLPVFLGCVAFALDVSWITLTRSELQNVADSAALAGVQQLMTNLPLHNMAGTSAGRKASLRAAAMAAARASARQYAAANSAGGVANLELLDA